MTRGIGKGRISKWWALLPLLALLLDGCGLKGQVSSDRPEFMPALTVNGETLLWGPEIKPEALQMIRSSTVFCHLTMYELSDPDILRALGQAHARGVDVKVVVDATEPHTLSTGLPFLRAHGILVRTLKIPGGISHIKSLVTEDRHGLHALLGGMNFGSYSWENHDASVYFSHAEQGFEGLFEQDYARAAGVQTEQIEYPLPLVYDDEILPAMLAAISQARHTIAIEAFAFTSKPFIAALEAAVGRGVSVRVLLDPQQSYNRKTAQELTAAGLQVRFYTPYNSEYLHAKILDVDQGRWVFVGSANFSLHGFSVNHEGDVALRDAYLFGKDMDQDFTDQFARGQAVSTES
ncbi:MAG: phospholipase D-like domain-containing protein [Firmicutes bacterium]|nr:phospholipase D-like domain-containing protein [Bacillota bacterium]